MSYACLIMHWYEMANRGFSETFTQRTVGFTVRYQGGYVLGHVFLGNMGLRKNCWGGANFCIVWGGLYLHLDASGSPKFLNACLGNGCMELEPVEVLGCQAFLPQCVVTLHFEV